MKFDLPSVSLLDSSSAIVKAIQSAKYGVLMVRDLPAAPQFPELQSTFDYLSSNPEGKALSERLNKAYTKNLVYKDSFAAGNGGPSVDLKRVLDLSTERMESIAAVDEELHTLLRQGLTDNLAFWENLQENAGMKLLHALAEASGSSEVTKDYGFNYRMVDYYNRTSNKVSEEAPRCGEHRDFGSFTLIFSTGPGLQVYSEVNKEWMDVPHEGGPTSAVLLFGWCTQIRSNGRIPAALHRVINENEEKDLRRRMSAVLFVAPKSVETLLEPVVLPGEERQYISGIKVGQLRGNMARKWRHREGTLSEEDKMLEEEEIRATSMKTQDDVVKRTVLA